MPSPQCWVFRSVQGHAQPFTFKLRSLCLHDKFSYPLDRFLSPAAGTLREPWLRVLLARECSGWEKKEVLLRSLEPCPGPVCLGLALELAQGRALARKNDCCFWVPVLSRPEGNFASNCRSVQLFQKLNESLGWVESACLVHPTVRFHHGPLLPRKWPN